MHNVEMLSRDENISGTLAGSYGTKWTTVIGAFKKVLHPEEDEGDKPLVEMLAIREYCRLVQEEYILELRIKALSSSVESKIKS